MYLIISDVNSYTDKIISIAYVEYVGTYESLFVNFITF
jgi:hypothetical protein